MPAASSGCRTNTFERESSAALTSNEGFSVVAPIRTMSPDSTRGRKASCCALLKRWISSTNDDRPPAARAAPHLGGSHHLLDLLDAGENGAEGDKLRPRHLGDDPRERGLAGAWRPPEDDRLQQIALDGFAQRFAGARIASWPITSSSVRGRIRSARGVPEGWSDPPLRSSETRPLRPPSSSSSKRELLLMVVHGARRTRGSHPLRRHSVTRPAVPSAR